MNNQIHVLFYFEEMSSKSKAPALFTLPNQVLITENKIKLNQFEHIVYLVDRIIVFFHIDVQKLINKQTYSADHGSLLPSDLRLRNEETLLPT